MAGSSTPVPNAAFAPVPSSGQRIDALVGSVGTLDQLSLANGMTAGFGDQDGQLTNFSPAFGQYGDFPFQPNRIGFIRNVPGSLPQVPGDAGANGFSVFALYFIYNPNQIQANFSIQSSQIPPLYLYGQGSDVTPQSSVQQLQQGMTNTTQSSVQVPNLVNTQTISWSLLFDRTYDMWRDPNADENRGVLVDVAALYNLMGTFETQAAAPISTPCQVVFGQTASGQLWGFTGYISSVTITYGIFRHNMIPSRAEVDIQFACVYTASQVPSTPANNPNLPAGSPPTIPSASITPAGAAGNVAAGAFPP